MTADSPSYDFICLCCGARNGETLPACSSNKYFSSEGEITEEFQEQIAAWFASDDYKGSLLVPENIEITEEYRLHIVEMTENYRQSYTGILLFRLPGVEYPAHAVSLSRFMN